MVAEYLKDANLGPNISPYSTNGTGSYDYGFDSLDDDLESENLRFSKGCSKYPKLSPNGFKGSRCFFVTNVGTGSWVSSHRKIVKVSKGDLFYMEGLTKMTGDKCRAQINVAAFDNNKDVIKWNLLRSGTDRTGEWIKLEKQFVIPDDNIKFLRFRLAGRGKGEYLFDNIIFRKLNFSDQNDQP